MEGVNRQSALFFFFQLVVVCDSVKKILPEAGPKVVAQLFDTPTLLPLSGLAHPRLRRITIIISLFKCLYPELVASNNSMNSSYNMQQ